MRKKLFTLFLALAVSAGTLFAESGTCGDNLTWDLTDGVLTISGTGAMEEYDLAANVPWYNYRFSINSVTINDGVTSISDYAFYDCSSLTSINVSTDNTNYCSIDGVLFDKERNVLIKCPGGRQGIYIIPNGVITIAYEAFYGCSGLSSVTIPNGVTSIGSYAFAGCNGLTSIEIPNSITNIEYGAFAYSFNLTSINVSTDNTNYSSIDGVLFSKDKATLVEYPGGKQGAYMIPSDVVNIQIGAFMYRVRLTSIEIPNSVLNIGEAAFMGCSGLNSITNYSTQPQTIDTYCFYDVNKSTCTLYVPAESVELYQAAEVWKEFGNILAIDDSTEEVNYATLADIYNMAADSTFTLGAFDVMYVPDFQSGSNMYIKDSTGSCVIYKVNYGLQAGDHVEAGLQGKVSIYNGLHEVIPITAQEELTITHGEAPAPMVATEAPSLNNASQYVVYEGVLFATDTAFVEGRRHTVYGSWNGQTITFYNQYYIGATLSANKTYNITAVNTIYRTTPQAYPLAVEEVDSVPDSCIIASGTCGAQGDNLTWTLTCDSVLTISGTGAMADYVASNSISPAPWYTYRTSINLVIIENGVTSIGNNAFYLCSDLTSIDIPNSVTSIGSGAFGNCRSLTSVTIPNSVTSIGIAAFYVCNGLTSVHISDIAAWCTISFGDYIANPLCYAHNLYVNEELVTDLVIPESVTSIGSRAFSNYSGLTSVTIPNSVTSIGYAAFYNCSGLTSVTIPNSVTSIGDNAFYLCTGLTSVTIPNSVTSIGSCAFEKCTGLTSVTIPNSVTSIGNNAFAYCSGLTSVHISDIAAWCAISFGDATANPLNNGHNLYVNEELVTDLVIPNSVTSIGSWVFSNCSGLTSVTIPNSVTSIGWSAFSNCSSLTSVTIPNSVTSIGGSAFYKCTGLTSVTIGNSVTSIGEYAFYNCSVLTSIINYAIEPQTINSNVFTNVDKSTCTLYVPAESIEAYKAANVWKEFGNILAIEDTPEPCITASGTCGAQGDNLTWMLSCDSVLTISGTGAMADYNINNPAPWYSYVLSVKTVVVNEGVPSIGMCAFMDCSGLTSVAISNSVTNIGGGAFARCASLSSVTIPNSVISIGDYTFQSCIGMTSVTIPNSVTSIGDYAFIDCRSLTYINIPNSVTSIGMGAFMWCESLTSIMIPDNVTYIAQGAFACCTSLNSINVTNDNTNYISIEGVLFAIKTKTILKQYPAGKQGAYTIPNNVTSIGSRAFEGSSGLTSVVIPNGVTNIGSRAFYGCSSLTSVTNYATTPQQIESDVFGGTSELGFVNKSACTLYVPAESVEAYKAADGWKDFFNILPIEGTEEPVETVEGNYTIYYVDKADQYLTDETVTLHVPVAPVINGFTFVEWRVSEGSLSFGITIQAIYEANEPTSAPAVYTNPANPAQKLIRNGNVYILTDDKIYTITGQEVK